jgi:hypothetical protein
MKISGQLHVLIAVFTGKHCEVQIAPEGSRASLHAVIYIVIIITPGNQNSDV